MGNLYINEKYKNKLKETWDKQKIYSIIQSIAKNNINICVYGDENYPKKLMQIDDPPFILSYLGDIKKVNTLKAVSIVGSRVCSNYGKDVALYIAKQLSAYNVNIISGMALGIDSVAHNVTIENDGFTTAILGCGIDIIYPRQNYRLYDKILEKGCLISEFLPNTQPYAYNFPTRNRIISGLSDLVIIVEAGEKSGTLITADAALNQGKEVVAVPGSIFSKFSIGCNKLISEGATPFVSINDLYIPLGIDTNKQQEVKKCKIGQNQKSIYNILSDTPMHIDDIIKILNVDISMLYGLLFEMQAKELVKCISGTYYVRNNVL
jgi:DNA processing protein